MTRTTIRGRLPWVRRVAREEVMGDHLDRDGSEPGSFFPSLARGDRYQRSDRQPREVTDSHALRRT
jgi:hypothetical protein